MNGLFIGLYGIYLLLVGFNGNSTKLKEYATADASGFFPWLISLAILAALYQNDATRRVAQPLLILVILTFILKNFSVIQKQSSSIWSMVNKSGTSSA